VWEWLRPILEWGGNRAHDHEYRSTWRIFVIRLQLQSFLNYSSPSKFTFSYRIENDAYIRTRVKFEVCLSDNEEWTEVKSFVFLLLVRTDNCMSCLYWLFLQVFHLHFNEPVAYPEGGPWPPPNWKVRGPNYHLAPPHSRYIRFFFTSLLLFIVYLITREGNSHLTTFSNNVCFYSKIIFINIVF